MATDPAVTPTRGQEPAHHEAASAAPAPVDPSFAEAGIVADDLRALVDLLDATEPQVQAEMMAVIQDIEPFRKMVESMPPEMLQAQQVASRHRRDLALLSGDFSAYDADLAVQGRMYAQIGLPFRDWFRLLVPYRKVLYGTLVPDMTPEQQRMIAAHEIFIGRAMALLGEAYVDEERANAMQARGDVQRYVELFRAAPVGMLLYEWVDPCGPRDFVLRAINPAALRQGGVPFSDGVGEKIGGRASDALLGEMTARYVQVMRSGDPERWSWRSDGDPPEVEAEVMACRVGLRHLGVLFENVTDKRRAERHARRSLEELERSNRELDAFAYVASHDLRAPLRDIDNLSRWIAEDLGDDPPEDTRRHLRLMLERIKRMDKLLDDLLEYSRAGRVYEEPAAFSLRHAIDDAVAMAGDPAGRTLTVTLQGPDAQLMTPREPLVRTLRNLINNAIKHHDRADGHVDIVALAPTESAVTIEVRDDGPGIAAEFHERVFQMFQTLRPRDDVEGSGMGLAIVRKLVEAHAGQVELQSESGRGTCVRIVWPLRWRRATSVA